jgi:hypothetical protein
MHLITNLVICGVLALVAVGVSLYHKYLEDHCDHYIHLHSDSHDASVVNAQSEACRRIEAMNRLRKGLFAAVIVYAVAIAAYAAYSAWNTQALS